MNLEYTFKEFFAIWANRMHWTIPEVHMKILDFIDSEDNWMNDTKVLLLWRGVGKSTLIDLWIAYKLSKEPKLRFLVLSADAATALKTSKDVLSIIQNHPLCDHLLTKELEVRQNRFFVKGSVDPRNASVEARGILSNVTGGRADYIVFDDVEVKKNSGDDTKRADLRTRIGEANNLLTGPRRRVFIGTYHDWLSVYDSERDNGAEVLKIPLLKNVVGEFPYATGESQWPTNFNNEIVEKIQRNCSSKAEWNSQYLLVPDNVQDTILESGLLQRYHHELEIKSVNKSIRASLGQHKIVSCSAWWDPALGKKRRDDSVLSIIFQDNKANLYIHRVFKLTGEAEEQVKAIKKYALEFEVPVVSVETNGIGAFLPQIMIKEFRGTGIAVDDQFTTKNKYTKIVESFETPLSGGFLYAHESVFDSPLLTQLREFGPQYRGKDDFLDSAASAINKEPVRIGGVGMGNTMEGQRAVEAWMATTNGEIDVELAKI